MVLMEGLRSVRGHRGDLRRRISRNRTGIVQESMVFLSAAHSKSILGFDLIVALCMVAEVDRGLVAEGASAAREVGPRA